MSELSLGDTLTVEQPTGYDLVPTGVWQYGVTSPGAVVAYLAIRRFSTMYHGKAVVSRAALADDMGVALRTADERIDTLIEGGWLLITPLTRVNARGQASNHFHLLWDPIESADDPRLVEHRRLVEQFDRWIASRQAVNAETRKADRKVAEKPRSVRGTQWNAAVTARRHKARADAVGRAAEKRERAMRIGAIGGDPVQISARGPRADFRAGPVQISARAPVQDPAPLESHSFESHSSESEELTSLRSEPAPEPASQTHLVALPGLGGELDEPTQSARRSPSRRSTPGTRMTPDWALSQHLIDWTRKNFPATPDAEVEKFRDYWLAKAGKDAVKRDWEAAWRNWCRNADEYRTDRGPTRTSAAGGGMAARNNTDWTTSDAGFGMPR